MEKELFVDSQCEEDEFPVLLMDWVEGETMEAYIAANYRNQSAMSMLSYRFGKMAAWLRTQSFSHGDIKPDNIIVRPDGSLTLVDYDGMFVPSMKGSQSPTIGTKDFSHPLRTVDDFDETIDDFSLASIALSLKAISMKSTLLDIYGASDRLLFSENDYRNPSNSKVISALQELMYDKDFCTLYSLFMLALARKELSACSFKLFIGEKPNITPVTNEDLSTTPTKEELKEAFVDEWGVKYSKDGRKLLDVSLNFRRVYSVKEGTKIICDRAFSLCSSLAEVVIPNSVTSIGDRAFSGCRSLAEVVIPNSVVCINGNPFFDWNGKLECLSPSFVYEDNILFNKDKSRIISFRNQKLTSYVIPASVTRIGEFAFSRCESLTKVVIPDSVTNIGKRAFANCCSLTEVVIPNSVTNIGKGAFHKCESLTEVVIPNSVTSIGDRTFCGCSSLTEVVIPNSVTSIGDRTFCGCSSLTEVVIPDSVTNIGKGAFAICSSLTEVVIPNSVTSIGGFAFHKCESLTEVVIPDSVVCINGNPFKDWNGKLECLSPSFVYEDNILFNKDKSRIISFRNQKLTSYVIPASVTRIGEFAFSRCESLTEVVISDSVTSIGDHAFSLCRSLTEVVIPDSVTSIGDGAFSSCESLRSVVIPDSVTSIGDWAFSYCSFPYDLKQELSSRFGEKIFR